MKMQLTKIKRKETTRKFLVNTQCQNCNKIQTFSGEMMLFYMSLILFNIAFIV